VQLAVGRLTIPAMTDFSAAKPRETQRSTAVLTRELARQSEVPLEVLLGPAYTKLFYDAYLPSTAQVTLQDQAKTALGVVTGVAHISHHTAVELWGGVAPATSRVHLTFDDRRSRSRRNGIAAHHSPLPSAVVRSKGLPISCPTQAFLDLASAGAELVDLVIAGDSLVKATRTRPDDFVRAADGWRGTGRDWPDVPPG
jgi:hypothetical protein